MYYKDFVLPACFSKPYSTNISSVGEEPLLGRIRMIDIDGLCSIGWIYNSLSVDHDQPPNTCNHRWLQQIQTNSGDHGQIDLVTFNMYTHKFEIVSHHLPAQNVEGADDEFYQNFKGIHLWRDQILIPEYLISSDATEFDPPLAGCLLKAINRCDTIYGEPGIIPWYEDGTIQCPYPATRNISLGRSKNDDLYPPAENMVPTDSSIIKTHGNVESHKCGIAYCWIGSKKYVTILKSVFQATLPVGSGLLLSADRKILQP
jgi:hypothetical protein